MFVSQAHSSRQQSRLAITLAWVAGYTNIISIMACATVTSHASGTTSNLGRELAEGTWGMAGWALFALVTFYAGAVISGVSMEIGRRRGWESIYVMPMMIETVLLACFAGGLEIYGPRVSEIGVTIYWIVGCAAAAMGLQNATITRISGGVIRTTHVTGVLTDLGSETAHLVAELFDGKAREQPNILHFYRHNPAALRLLLLASILGSFAIGAYIGTLIYLHSPRLAMFPPVLFLVWIIYQDVTRPIAEILPSHEAGGELAGIELPDSLAIYHLRKDPTRRGKVQRLPNLVAWSERLPTTTRVVILDLAEMMQVDGNTTMELRALLAALARRGRQLVIAGLNNEQFQKLHTNGAADLIESAKICPDLELAIAQGLNLVHESRESETT